MTGRCDRRLDSASPRTRRLTALAQLLSLTGLLVLYAVTIDSVAQHAVFSDFGKFYTSARFFLDGRDIYTPLTRDFFGTLPDTIEVGRDTLHPNLNPPFVTLLLIPFALLDYGAAYRLWAGLSLICGALAMALVGTTVLRRPASRRLASWFWLWILLLAYFPTWASIQLGQVSLLLFLLLAVAWLAGRRDHDRLAGIALGLALSLKLFAGVLVLFFAARRRWAAVAWSLGVFLLGTLAGLLLFGLDTYRRYCDILGSVTWYAASWNASLMGFCSRLFGGSENIPLVNLPRLSQGLALGFSAALIVGVMWLARMRCDDEDEAVFDMGFSLSLAVMLLVSPLGWMYYFPVLLITFLSAWSFAGRSATVVRYRAMILAAFLLSTVPHPLLPSREMNSPADWFTWAGFYFYALALLCITLGLMICRLQPKRCLRSPQAVRGPEDRSPGGIGYGESRPR